VLYGNPVLRVESRPVKNITRDLAKLLADLKTTMIEQDGLGLAANQIAEPVSVFALNPRSADQDENPYCVLNPRVVATEGRIEAEEGCLSLPGVYDILPRPELVRVTGQDESGRPVTFDARGMLARAVLHEIDHLHGVLFIDHLSPTRRRMLATRLEEIEAREAAECR
jgi:peptide deformylase